MSEPGKSLGQRAKEVRAAVAAERAVTGEPAPPASTVIAPSEIRDRIVAARSDDDTGVAILSPETTQKFRDMIMALPLADPAEATDRIVAALLAATDLDALNEPWESDKLERLLDKALILDTLKVLPSRYAEGPGIFLRVEGADEKTGERIGFATSSWAIMAQLTAAYMHKLLPILARPMRSENPTTKGYFPLHLFVLATRYRVHDTGTTQ